MDVDEIVAEMQRKPDAHLLVGWIDDQIPATLDPTLTAIARAIGNYFAALDEG